ncbi:MAG: ribosomal-processing cysteine protease Prp [Clostridia bacterium]|nr:ribosomal-processing cysteine protease Prp [Clostridia bacterium]
MTEAVFFTADGVISGVHVFGHSGYAEEGEDIVCAAVSSAVIMTANTLTELMDVNAEVQCSDGDIKISVPREKSEQCSIILQGLKLHLLELEKQYSDFIEVKFTEV